MTTSKARDSAVRGDKSIILLLNLFDLRLDRFALEMSLGEEG